MSSRLLLGLAAVVLVTASGCAPEADANDPVTNDTSDLTTTVSGADTLSIRDLGWLKAAVGSQGLLAAYQAREKALYQDDYVLRSGPWRAGRRLGNVTSDFRAFAWSVRPDMEPELVWGHLGNVFVGDELAMRLDQARGLSYYADRHTEDTVALARSASGGAFVAYSGRAPAPTRRTPSPDYDVWVASRASGAAWASPRWLTKSNDMHQLGFHVRTDGLADVLVAQRAGDVNRYRASASGTYTREVLVPRSSINTRPEMLVANGPDGVTHVIAQVYDPYASPTVAEVTYLRLDDQGVARRISLGAFTDPVARPFRDLGVDAAGNVLALKRVGIASVSLVAISPTGVVSQAPLYGLEPKDVALAVAPSGEIAIVQRSSADRVGVVWYRPRP